jgi:ABC-2 type transport system ATP-binding protein
VDDLSFDVRAGTVTGFLGPNGLAGKTTTLRIAARPGASDQRRLRSCTADRTARSSGRPSPSAAVLEAAGFHPRADRA